MRTDSLQKNQEMASKNRIQTCTKNKNKTDSAYKEKQTYPRTYHAPRPKTNTLHCTADKNTPVRTTPLNINSKQMSVASFV